MWRPEVLQYDVLCCQSFRIEVFGDLVLPGQRRDLFLVLPGRSATSCTLFCPSFGWWFVRTAHFFSQQRLFLSCIIISNPPVDPVFRRSRIGDRCSRLRAIKVQGTGLPLRQLPSGMGELLAERQ